MRPVRFRKVRVKWLWSAKPASSAISASGRSVSATSLTLQSMRNARTPVEFEEVSAGVLNVDFDKKNPLSHPRNSLTQAFYPPFNMRFAVRLDF